MPASTDGGRSETDKTTFTYEPQTVDRLFEHHLFFTALASNRVSPRRAGTLAYIGCLLSQTEQGAKVEDARWDLDAPTLRKLVELKYTTLPAVSSGFISKDTK